MSEDASYVRNRRVKWGNGNIPRVRSECSDEDNASGLTSEKRLAKKVADSMWQGEERSKPSQKQG
jgi:hypothetical protein